MSVQIKRNTGFVGSLSHVNILKNGEKVRKMRNNEKVDVFLPDEGATIQATQLGAKTKETHVKSGDQLEIKTTFLGKYGIFLMILLGVILDAIFNHYVQIGVYIAYILIIYFVDGLMYKVVKQPSPSRSI